MSKQDIVAAAQSLAANPNCDAALSHLLDAVFQCPLDELPPIALPVTIGSSIRDMWAPLIVTPELLR